MLLSVYTLIGLLLASKSTITIIPGRDNTIQIQAPVANALLKVKIGIKFRTLHPSCANIAKQIIDIIVIWHDHYMPLLLNIMTDEKIEQAFFKASNKTRISLIFSLQISIRLPQDPLYSSSFVYRVFEFHFSFQVTRPS